MRDITPADITPDCPEVPPEPLPGMIAGLQFSQAASLKALREGEGRGLTTRQMALHIERESGYRDLYDALEGIVKRAQIGFGQLGDEIGYGHMQKARAALAKARGDKPDAQMG